MKVKSVNFLLSLTNKNKYSNDMKSEIENIIRQVERKTMPPSLAVTELLHLFGVSGRSELLIYKRKNNIIMEKYLVTSLSDFLYEKTNYNEGEIKKEIFDYYNNQIKNKIKIEDIDIQIIDGVYVIWIPKEVFQQMGKKGFSENDGEKNRLVISKHLKENDPACMLAHELGHLDCFKNHKEYWHNRKPIIKDTNIRQNYPNWLDEYYPFYNQYKALKKKYIDREKILNGFLSDYIESGYVPEKDLNEYKEFFKKLIDIFEKK